MICVRFNINDSSETILVGCDLPAVNLVLGDTEIICFYCLMLQMATNPIRIVTGRLARSLFRGFMHCCLNKHKRHHISLPHQVGIW